jgi:anti-sigma-K factor RskA
MTGPACRNVRQALGVYVVGAIDPAERMLVDLHVATCAECREELAGLAALPALLALVPAHDAERLMAESTELREFEEPPAELLASLLCEVSARRAAGRWWGIVASAAAVVLAVAVGVTGAHILARSTPAPPPVAVGRVETVSAYNPQTQVGAVVSYKATSWGTMMDVRVTGVPAGTTCQLWVVNIDGTRSPAGSWKVAYGHTHADYPGSAELAAKDVSQFQITSGPQVEVTVPVD